jgi:glutathione S-transferase
MTTVSMSSFVSNAIIKYLCRKHGSTLYPDGLREQAAVDQWCDFVASLLVPAYGPVLFNPCSPR